MDIIGKRFWFFLISGVIILIGIISLVIFGLKTGVEFSSGSVVTVNFEQEVNQRDLGQGLANLGYGGALIQRLGTGDFLIRLPELNSESKTKLEADLTTRFGALKVEGFDSVSPMIASETTRNTVIAVVVAALFILLYLAWAFRKMPNPFRFGTCAVIALAHDTLVVTGIFSICGAIFGWEINLMFVTGILAIIGYSVNNTVVVFDRIRENQLKSAATFDVVVNNSMIETLGRSLNTSLTTIFTVVALMLFVGASIQNFVIVLLIGIIAGTFDSVCVAPSLLVVWRKGEWGRFIGRKPLPASGG
ncbi:MAG: protein translocase subunit SecF [Chloroflexota bacterium]